MHELRCSYARWLTLLTEPEPEPELEPEHTWSDLESEDWLNDIPDIFQGNQYKYLFLLRSVSKT